MVLRSFAGALLALAVATSPALACKGETEFYSDDFTTSDGPWDATEGVTIGGGFATIKPDAGRFGGLAYTGGKFQEFDLCVDITFPETSGVTPATLGGILFWINGNPVELYDVLISPLGLAVASRVVKEREVLVSPVRKYPAIKSGAGAQNTLRITAQGNTVTVNVNDQKIAAFRGNPAEGYLAFFALSQPEMANEWKFSNFKLTDPPK